MAFAGQRVLVEHHSSAGPSVLQVRGSLLVSSLDTLRELNLYGRYQRSLPAAYHDQVPFVLAASWVPIELAMAHYAACDDMELSESELEQIGVHVARRISDTFLASLIRTASTESSPLQTLPHYARLWDRLLMGGACKITQVGPKDATIESRGLPMFRHRYFREAYAAMIRGIVLLLRRTAYVKLRRCNDSEALLELSWV